MNNKIFMILPAIFLSGCTTVKYNYIPEVNSYSIPPLGVQQTTGLGEPLLDQGISTEREVIKIPTENSIYAYKIKPGKLIKIGSDENAEYYSQDIQSGLTIYSGLIVSTPDLTATVQYRKKTTEFCITRPLDATVCGKIDISKEKEKILTTSSFRRTLIYSGRVGNKLKINYREFSNDIARVAFNTDAEYDLGEGNIIGYAGARIEVINATNKEIKYIVIKNFNTK